MRRARGFTEAFFACRCYHSQIAFYFVCASIKVCFKYALPVVCTNISYKHRFDHIY